MKQSAIALVRNVPVPDIFQGSSGKVTLGTQLFNASENSIVFRVREV